MKLKLSVQQLGGLPPATWLRRAGYTFIVDHQSGQESFVRRLDRDFYPRFHLYLQENQENSLIFFNLHLDQKKASYAGQTRHSADYDGELVEAEIARLSTLLLPINPSAFRTPDSASAAPVASQGDILSRLSAPLPVQSPVPSKKSWWQKIFS